MRRLALGFLLFGLALLALPALADAHPLGNFTVNQYSRIQPSGGRVYVLYVLDLAEIPTFQARDTVAAEGPTRYAAALSERIASGVRLTSNGRPLALRELRHELAFPAGQAGLRTTRLEVLLTTHPLARDRTVRLAYRDTNFAGRLGWKEVVVAGDSGAHVLASSAPSRSLSDELLAYPQDSLKSPLSVRSATLRVSPGVGAGSPPALVPARELEQRAAVRATADSGFAALIGRGDLGVLVILASLGAALFWGAAHALSPGHGKTIIAAYLVGQRGKVRHAAYLGGIVTVTHTIGVFALGLVTLALSQFIVPDQLYPWLNLVSGLLVVGIGLSVFVSRFRRRLAHARAHAHGLDHDHGHHHHGHKGSHGHSHVPQEPGLRGLLAVGVSGGLLPCPSALVVLLAAISLHRVAFGLLLILAFSLGLALTISAIGVVALFAKRAFNRMSFQGRLVSLLPAASALVILVFGVVMTVHAIPHLS